MRHLFVVTYGRSGSTVLVNLLNAIDGYCIRGENGGVLAKLALAARRLAEVQVEQAPHNQAPDTPWYGIAEVDPDQWARTLAEGFERDVLRPPPGTRVTGFKEIRYIPEFLDESQYDATIAFMADAFPDSRFIFNTRHHAEIARSGWWPDEYTPREVETLIAQCDARFRRSTERLGKRGFLIDHADYNGRPEGFAPLLAWLGEELAPERVAAICERQLTHLKYEDSGEKAGLLSRLRALLPR